MQIVIHRSAAQIGGNVVEVRGRKARVVLDAGRELPPLDGSRHADRMEVEGLTFGQRAFDAGRPMCLTSSRTSPAACGAARAPWRRRPSAWGTSR